MLIAPLLSLPEAVLLAAGLVTVASLGAAYAAWKLVKTTRGK